MKSIDPAVSEELADIQTYIHTDIHTDIQRGYGYYRIDWMLVISVFQMNYNYQLAM